MSCYTKIIKAKSHKEVRDIVDKVITEKMKPEEAAKELKLTKHEFDELYEEMCKNLKVLTV